MDLTEKEKRMLASCIKMAIDEGLWLLPKDATEEELISILPKLGYKPEYIEDAI